MASTLEGDRSDFALDHISTHHRHGPWQVAAGQHFQIDIERRHRRGKAEWCAEKATLGAEVQLDHGAGGQPPRSPPREGGTQEPRLVDGQARSEPMGRADFESPGDHIERVGVDEWAARYVVIANATEIDRSRIGQADTQDTARRQAE